MSEPQGKSDTQLAIESFVDKMQELHPNLDREEFHNGISSCVHEVVQEEKGGDESEENEGEES